jgi:hypothetical protein
LLILFFVPVSKTIFTINLINDPLSLVDIICAVDSLSVEGLK